MIAVSKALSKLECKAISEMLISETFTNLCRVVSGKMDAEQVNAISDRRQAQPDNLRGMAAEQSEKKAADYETFLRVAAELKGVAISDSIFSVVEIKPTA